jgi:hypothetical protein
LIWPKAGFASIACAATASVNFLPLGSAHSSRDKKAAGRCPPLRCGPAGASSIASGLSIAIEAAMGAVR